MATISTTNGIKKIYQETWIRQVGNNVIRGNNMTLSMNEAIQLILDFRYILVGYWKDIPIEDPLICQFIKEGYATLDLERQEKYVLNDAGADFLHVYIKQISTAFIEFIEKKRLCCFDSDGICWFSDKYNLDNEMAESLYDYITYNLEIYGYKRQRFYQTDFGWGYDFEKVI